MTNTRRDLALSPIELIILSRLSSIKPPSEAVLTKTLSELTPHTEKSAAEVAHSTLINLRARGLIQADRRVMTEAGNRALQSALGIDQLPTWTDIHTSHLLALALGLPPGTEQAEQATATGDSIARTYLKVVHPMRRNDKAVDKHLIDLFQLSSSKLTMDQIRIDIADRIIRDKLGLTGPVTLSRMRAHAAARYSNTQSRVFTGSREQLFKELSQELKAPCQDKASARRAIIRKWAYENAQARVVESPRAPVGQTALFGNGNGNGSAKPEAVKPAQQPAPSLLQTVRDTLPRIGSDGRFGAEKVFISALWHRLERDRSTGLSLDRFKTWLIDANREQQLDLVRADLVGAMDPKLVAESEIEDLGATFHFVVDRQAGHRRSHA